MISAPPVGMEKVSGSRRLMVARGPRPGRSPTSVPTVQPIAQNMRFCSVSAWLKPNARLFRISIMSVERQLQAETFLEDEGDADEDRGDHGVAVYRGGAPGERRAEDEEDDARDHVDVGQQREAHEAAHDDEQVPQVEGHR